jgi:hypothetical protein
MTAMEGGNADIAGVNICPYILTIAAPPSLALCVIPYILYIKKARSMRAFEYQLVKKAFSLLLDR